MSDQPMKFNKQFFADLWALLKPFWQSKERYIAFLLLGLSILGIIIEVRAGVAINGFNKDFFDALQHFDKAALNNALRHFMLLLAVQVLAVGYAVYFNGLLSIRWRRWLTDDYIKRWLANQNYYRMQLHGKKLDNPDQRISEDLADFVSSTLTIFLVLVQAVLSLSSFGYVLWKLSGIMPLTIGGYQLFIPGYLCLGALFYAILGTWVTGYLGKKLSRLDYQQQRYSADFRFSLIRLREASEQVALYGGEQAESHKLKQLFAPIFANFLNINLLQRRLTFFTNGYNTVSYVIGLLMAVPLYFHKKLQLGGLMQATGAMSTVIITFSVLIEHYAALAQLRAIVHRLAEFNHFVQSSAGGAELGIQVSRTSTPHITVKDLNLLLPNGEPLLRGVDFTLPRGSKILLKGNSGVGKSTLIKALASIWPFGSGQIHLPERAKVFFMPQRPYMPQGTLREILAYPASRIESEQELLMLLKQSGLHKFVEQLDEVKSWSQELSLGEQQKIAFVRVLLSQPDIIFLDEATSALDDQAEIQLYSLLHKRLPNATVISIGHRSSLHQFHTANIVITADGNQVVMQEAYQT